MYTLERIQRHAIRVGLLYNLKCVSIVTISALMRSIGWIMFRYIFKHRLCVLRIYAIQLDLHEYLAQFIIIQSYNRSSRKCHVMKLVQLTTYLAYPESAFSVIAPKSWNSLPYDIRCTSSLSLFIKCKLYVHFKSL